MQRRSVLMLSMLATALAAAQDDPRLAQSREIAAELQQTLSTRLMSALGDRGAAGAVAVCKTEAPDSSASLSAQAGARVARTALKVRNPVNAPDAGARSVLESFQAQIAAGAAQPPEHFEVAADGSARYMRAIVTQPLCLTCHGPQLTADVRDTLAEHYPADQATGFAVGDMRGAFLIEWPSPGETQP